MSTTMVPRRLRRLVRRVARRGRVALTTIAARRPEPVQVAMLLDPLDRWAGRAGHRPAAWATVAPSVAPVVSSGYRGQNIPPQRFPYHLGSRRRVATCSAVAWTDDCHFVVTHLQSGQMRTIALVADGAMLEVGVEQSLPEISYPDSVAVGAGGLFAVIDSGRGRMALLRIDLTSSVVDPHALACVDEAEDRTTHGVAFGPDGRTLYMSSVSMPGNIRVFSVDDHGDDVELRQLQVLENRYSPIKPKGLEVSPDGRWLLVSYGINVSAAREPIPPAAVMSFRRHEDGTVEVEPTSVRRGLRLLGCTFECVAFHPSGRFFAVTDQGSDSARLVAFDPDTGAIGRTFDRFVSPRARLSFPHGLAFSPDGSKLAVSNFGDDSVAVFTLDQSTISKAVPVST